MGQFFSKDFAGGPFVLFDATHLLTLLVVILVIIGLTRFKGKSESTRRAVRITLAIILWVNEAGWHIWRYSIGEWTAQEMLPLHLCSVLIWLSGFMLITKNYRIYEFVYFMGIGGAMQALLTPDVGIYAFPHFRYIQTFISHGLLVGAGVYMTVVEGLRPTWKSILRVMVGMNIYMAIIFPINLLVGSNYLMINHKPATASLIDLLPVWPWYIPFLELIGLVICLLLYLPFAIKDGMERRESLSQPDQAAG
jgi:hypothetical integral membrane protein (TIGR02206 family)